MYPKKWGRLLAAFPSPAGRVVVAAAATEPPTIDVMKCLRLFEYLFAIVVPPKYGHLRSVVCLPCCSSSVIPGPTMSEACELIIDPGAASHTG